MGGRPFAPVLLLALAHGLPANAEGPGRRPNVVLIVADDEE
jgi:hypothetical protein